MLPDFFKKIKIVFAIEEDELFVVSTIEDMVDLVWSNIHSFLVFVCFRV